MTDKNRLAHMMLRWADQKDEIEALEWEIKQAVMDLKETVITGEVRARYNSPRQTFDYQKAAEDYLEIDSNHYTQAVEDRTTVIEKINWKAICDDENIEQTNIPVELGEPSVTLKLDK